MLRWLSLPILFLAFWSFAAKWAVAQADSAASVSGDGNWMTCYVLVLLGIGLGMLPVCHPAKRKVWEKEEIKLG